MFRWPADDWDRLAAGTLAGHLLECGAQVTGGYFADPGDKDVPGLAEIGYPIAEIEADGDIVITKPAGTGGVVNRLTVIEQLLYEIHDPAAYFAPDVVLDLTSVDVIAIGKDRVRVAGARGKPAPETLKATVCVDGGILGEAEISYAGINAAARAGLAAEVICERMRRRAPGLVIRVDAIGAVSVLGNELGCARFRIEDPKTYACAFPRSRPMRLRSRCCSTRSRRSIAPALRVVLAFAGASTPRLASASCLVERHYAETRVTLLGAPA